MKFLCSTCGKVFESQFDCQEHEKWHKGDVMWRQVHLRRESGKWTFTYSDSRLGHLDRDVPVPNGIHRSSSSDKDWPVWWAACRNSDEAIAETKRRLIWAAIGWYSERVSELKLLGETIFSQKEKEK